MKKSLILIIFIFSLTLISSSDVSAVCYRPGETEADANTLTPIYRLYNVQSGVHLYTRGITDAEKILGKYSAFEFTDGTPAFCASLSNVAGLTPIYRLYNKRSGVHLYTRGEADKNKVLAKWSDFEFTDGTPAFYASLSSGAGTTPIYRLYNKRTGVHLYTRGDADKNKILAKWSDFEFTDGAPAFYLELASTLNPSPEKPSALGDDIQVGLYARSRGDSQSSPFKIESTNHPYVVKKDNGTIIATVPAGTTTEISYDDNSKLKVDIPGPDVIVSGDVHFEAADPTLKYKIVFDVHKPDSSYDEYRTGIRVHYDNNDKLLWVINDLPLEHYVWGIGEMTATGPTEYNRAMTAIFRSYGRYKVTESVEHKYKGFDTVPDSSDQIYRGYEWEQSYPRIREAAEATRGKLVYYDGDPILTPFGSWTDGRTRNYADGHFSGQCRADDGTTSSIFPYLLGVNDQWGKHPSLSTCDLANAGNHMVGISAQGALSLAGDHGWKWDAIIKHYLTGVSIQQLY